MGFQYLTNVHTARHTQRVEDDVHWGAVLKERHVFHRDHTRNNTFVTMTACHFVASGQFTTLSHRHANHHIYTGREVNIVFTGEDFNIHHFTTLAMGHAQGGIFNITRFLTEDGAQEAFFRSQLFFTFRGDLADQNVIGANFSADAHNALFIQVFDGIFTYIGDIAGDLFRT